MPPADFRPCAKQPFFHSGFASPSPRSPHNPQPSHLPESGRQPNTLIRLEMQLTEPKTQ
ncbi:uncharacterized protein BO97DRAFT_405593 [Aspergillus homomorphus CBS 101889]|uniref:Uncharacterized protein n=1 Tax=Aspergillus homomorphus (strain CBS 101889) TaxID=1450537 RepID=A0A395HXX6_ASPHC|nr:hypothetical protein BO97DRAFT_405593 [Aspergillus homomorphus CBS 101889]RAL12243.1 hypothetical protein BO97DRAFT_405593 [Aspergillus homomorphus CBS 101889]